MKQAEHIGKLSNGILSFLLKFSSNTSVSGNSYMCLEEETCIAKRHDIGNEALAKSSVTIALKLGTILQVVKIFEEEEKFVVIELSEETLVDTIEIANFEHYSFNVKQFELLESLVFPADVWTNLGNFTTANVKLVQRFVLQEPKCVRYLKLNLLGRYGSKFYCTLSVIELYEVDAMERMMEDLISVQDNLFAHEDRVWDQKQMTSQAESTRHDGINQISHKEMGSETLVENSNVQFDSISNVVLSPKIRALDLSLSVLERYLEELNSKYSNIFKEFVNDIGEKDRLLEKIKANIKDLLDSQKAMAKDVVDIASWKSLVSVQLNALARDNADLKWNVEKASEVQTSIENKFMAVFVVTIVFGLLASLRKLMTDSGKKKVLVSWREANNGDMFAKMLSWMLDCMEELVYDVTVQDKINMESYKNVAEDFGRKIIVRARDTLLPVVGWFTYLLGDAPVWLLPISVFCPLYKHKLRAKDSAEKEPIQDVDYDRSKS
ncbi:hypothetical protein V6N12_065832 [Hibiscus sabdariffa]|uniref:SUN domain-containing protein n=1 Tax=Hibiscus sabdariffa TaxID=183260 RepID=A0ABR2G9U8_9ROSI